MVEGLPHRVPPALRVRVQCHLEQTVCQWDSPLCFHALLTSVSNQNFSSNCRKIFVYVACPKSALTPRTLTG